MEEILNKMFEVAKEKRLAIHSQQYETAARLRDNEKTLENELFNKIFISTGIIPLTAETRPRNSLPPTAGYMRKYDSLEKYFLEFYGVEYSKLFEEDTFKLVKRDITLRKLGI